MRPDTIWSPLVFEQDSRIYPPWDIFDYFPFDVHPHSPEAFNGISPDTIKIGGVSGMPPDLEPGIKEHMFSILFEAGGIAIDEVKTICLDGAQIISQPDFVFAGIISGPIHPIVGWPEGGKCWPVKRMPCICCLDYSYQGDANVDGSLNVGDAVFLIDHIFKNGPAPASKYCGEANGDGVLNVGDAVYMINYVFKNGDPPVWYLGP